MHAFASMGSDSNKKPGLDNFELLFQNQNLNPNNSNTNPISNFYFDQFQNPISNPSMINSENNIINRVASKLFNF